MAFENLTEWPKLGEFPLLCVSVGSKAHWVKGIFFDNLAHTSSRIFAPAQPGMPCWAWVGSGNPEDWHLHDPATCHE